MTGIWSHRPRFLHLGLFFSAFVLGAGFAQLLAIVPGTGISIWPPSGLFIATLILTPVRSWPWWVLAGCLAELFANFLWFHSSLPAALLMNGGNALEAVAGAWLVNRFCGRVVRLESLQEVLAFIVLGAGIAPMISATVGAATVSGFGMLSQTFDAAWPLFWIGDATGALVVGPLVFVVAQDWRRVFQLSLARWAEAALLGLIFLGFAVLTLGGFLPFAYIIMPPLLWAAVRFELGGAAVALTLLTVITAVFTLSGASQFAGDPESRRQQQIMLQLFLAVSALSALIVAAVSRQQRQALATLRQSERELRQLVDVVPVAIGRLEPNGEPSFFNKRLLDFLGLNVRDVEEPDGGRRAAIVTGALHPDDIAGFSEALNHSFVTGGSFARKYRLRRADGMYRWVEGRVEPLRDKDGEIVKWYGATLDIDDEVRAQEALREREREFKLFIDMVPGHVWRLSAEGEPTFYNRRLRDFLGFDVSDVGEAGLAGLQAAISDIVHPEDASATRQALGHSLATGVPFSIRHRVRRVDGIYRWLEVRAEPLRDDTGAILQWYGVNVDIDDQVRLSKDFEEQEAKIRRLFDSDVIGIVFWDLNGTLIDANDAFLRMVQYDREELKAGLDWFAMTPPEWQEVHAREEAAELAATGRMQPREKEYFRKDGSRAPILIGAACFEGNSRQGVAYILDLTEQKRAAAALRDRERELSQLVDMVPVHIRRLTPEGEPIFFNKRLRDFYGLDLADLDRPGTSRLVSVVEATVHPDDAARLLETASQSFASGNPFSIKYRTRRADGVYRWVDTRTAPLRDEGGAILHWYATSIDIDDEVQGQEVLRQAHAKLAQATQAASLAELTASIAHEVNQPLAAIVADSLACQHWLASEPPNLARAKITVERLVRDANSAADVVGHIRALFKQSAETRANATLSSVIDEAGNLMADEAAQRRVAMKIDIEKNLPTVAFDRIQIQQVLVNLIRNGIEAMDSVGGDKVLTMRVRRMGDVIQTEISDHGRGIEFPDKIFEPFFTTKEQGMGMGLAICRSIVESHGGRLWAERNEPRGATFVFTLPFGVNETS